MSLLPFNRAFIEMPVTSRTENDTVFRQMARYQSMTIFQDDAAAFSVRLYVRVVLHAADGDGFGRALIGRGLAPYTVELKADNNTLVAFPSGDILAIRADSEAPTAEGETAWAAQMAEFAHLDTMLQGDFFGWVLENEPIKIGDLIRQHIQQADTMGRFA